MNDKQLKIYDDNLMRTVKALALVQRGAVEDLLEQNLSFVQMLSRHGIRISYTWEETN